MQTTLQTFSVIATELEYLHSRRESIINGAFEALSGCSPALAGLLLEALGDRRRAAFWLGLRQRAFSGHSAWDLLAEGDEETVWDAASRLARLTPERTFPDPVDRLHAA